MRTLKSLAFLAGLLPAVAAAQVPQFPQTLPANTVVGRLGVGAGPVEAIPFAVLSSHLNGAIITLNSGNGQTAPGAMAGGNTYSFGATTDTVQMTSLGLGGAAPTTGLKVFNAAVAPGGTGQGSVGASSTNGAGLIGQGSIYDSYLGNLSGNPALGVTTNTQNVVLLGTLTAASLSTVGTVAGSLCATSAGLILYEAGVNCYAVSGISVANGKTLTISNTLTFNGTDGTTFTYPGASTTLAGLGTNQTFTGTDTFSGTLNITGTGQINGTAFGTFATQNYATPPAIGGTTPNTGAFSTLTATTPIGVASGGTNGGTAQAARSSTGLNIDELTSKGDTNYTILATDRTVGTSATLTAARTWTLPAASSVNAGQHLIVQDFVGGVSNTNTLTIARAGSDTINGSATSITINSANGGYLLISNGVSNWSAQALGAQATAGVASINGQTGSPSIVAGTAISVSTSGGNISVANTGATAVNGQTGNVAFIQTPQIRLTLTQGTPVTTSDVTGATSVYLEPYNGSQLSIYDGTTNWVPLPVAASTYSLPATQTQSGTTHTNTVLDGLTDTSQMIVGEQVTGTNIAANTTIASITSSTSVTLNNATTGSATNTMTFKLPPTTSYDICATNNGGVPKLIWYGPWTGTTPPSRTLQNGVYTCGTTSQRLLGSVYTTATAGTLTDSAIWRGLSNVYNQVPRTLLLKESASTWNYSASAWTQVNNGTADQIQVMLSVAGFVQVEADAMWSNSVSTGANTWTGIGLDSTSASSSTTTIGSGTSVSGITGVDIAQYNGAPGIGPHYFSWLIWGAGANTQTWYGTNAIPDRIQTGLTGMMLN